MSVLPVVLATFLASLVEAVEALTVVIATGVTRGYRSALAGAGLAFLILAAVVLAGGQALVRYVPLDALRVVVGAFLLSFGLQWLRKAVLRAAGHMPRHDEDAIFERQVSRLSEAGQGKASHPHSDRLGRGIDRLGFTTSFKVSMLEGLEVMVIVVGAGSTSHQLGWAETGALGAIAVVALAGVVLSRQLSNVPENMLKMAVALFLTTFGSFWMGEGLKVAWPGSDLFLFALFALYGGAASLYTLILKRQLSNSAALVP
jgi:uncharacterized membrane protein